MDGISFTLSSGQIVAIASSAVTAVGGVAVAAIKLLYSNINGKFRTIDEKFEATQGEIQRARIEQHNFTRSVFVLLTRLHPDKSGEVVEAMQDAFADPLQPNGEARRRS